MQRMRLAGQINEIHPDGNRAHRRFVAKLLRIREKKQPAYKKLNIVPWWLIPKKVAEEVKA